VSVAERLELVRGRIQEAARAAGREASEVELVAVSKRHSQDAIREAYAAGQRVFGENYVQEWVSKADALAAELPDLRWHFIGHLQRNKARQVVQRGACLETLDSPRLALALARHVTGAPVSVFLQVNVGREAQKSGVLPDDLSQLVDVIRGEERLRLEGLMTVPPADPNPEAVRPHFAELAALAKRHGLRSLSMGMSADLEVAVAEGATHVRVGTAIFGPR
jgi:pyridoxal phosphate enzyme (YggS family)